MLGFVFAYCIVFGASKDAVEVYFCGSDAG
jgi:hypothetical protein